MLKFNDTDSALIYLETLINKRVILSYRNFIREFSPKTGYISMTLNIDEKDEDLNFKRLAVIFLNELNNLGDLISFNKRDIEYFRIGKTNKYRIELVLEDFKEEVANKLKEKGFKIS